MLSTQGNERSVGRQASSGTMVGSCQHCQARNVPQFVAADVENRRWRWRLSRKPILWPRRDPASLSPPPLRCRGLPTGRQRPSAWNDPLSAAVSQCRLAAQPLARRHGRDGPPTVSRLNDDDGGHLPRGFRVRGTLGSDLGHDIGAPRALVPDGAIMGYLARFLHGHATADGVI